MPFLQLIEHHGHVAAVVAGGRAIIADDLPKRVRRVVAAKCLYALEIEADERAGPYRDHDAEQYAGRALVTRDPGVSAVLAGPNVTVSGGRPRLDRQHSATEE